MSREELYWLNVDIPTKKCTLHRAGCIYETSKQETSLKGIRQLKRDGGWLSFSSELDATATFTGTYAPRDYRLASCAKCNHQ